MTVPEAVRDAYGASSATALPGGLINATYLADDSIVLQRLHPIFSAEVNIDIAAITAHIAARGVSTPRLVETREGALWFEHDGDVWRALTFIPGVTIDAVDDPRIAESAGHLIGRFHAALSDLDHTFAFTRLGVHDTSAHLDKLRRLVGDDGGDHPELATLGEAILETAAALPAHPALPERISHGDLKISNIRFAPETDPLEALCLLDLDTLGHMTLAYELGDAMRSWCGSPEDDELPRFRSDIFAAALAGYRRGNPDLDPIELRSVPLGTLTVAVELAARFCADGFEDSYFGWDADRFPSRRAHNVARARNQLALGGQIRTVLGALDDAVSALH